MFMILMRMLSSNFISFLLDSFALASLVLNVVGGVLLVSISKE